MRTIRSPEVAQTLEDHRQILIDHHALIRPFSSTTAVSSTSQGGEVAHELIVVTAAGATTQSLHANPYDEQRVTVKQSGAGVVTVDTADANTIDGAASITFTSQNELMEFMYSELAGKWLVVCWYHPYAVVASG